MIDDLRHYRAPERDAFQIISPDLAVFLVCAAFVLGYCLAKFGG